jgi:hypothetical protein
LKLPPIGPPPKHILQNKVQVKTAGKFARLKDAAEKSKPHVPILLQEYLDAFLEAMEDFRILAKETPSQTFDDEVVKNIEHFLPYRDNLIDAFFVVAKFIDNEEAYDHVFEFFENLLAFQFRPDHMNSWNDVLFDNFHFLIYEISLYFMGVMAKTKRYTVIRRFFESTYLVRGDHMQKESRPFSTFNYHARSLNEIRNKRLKLNLISLVGEMITTRPHPTIKVAIQALYGVKTLNDLHDRVEIFSKSRLFQVYNEHYILNRIPFRQLLNIEEIGRALGKPSDPNRDF